MNILFVCSGNSGNVTPIVKNQADSLVELGHSVDYYTIKGKGILGYIKNIVPLKNQVTSKNYDIVHAHYSLSAFVASLAGIRSLFVSLMGSDVKSSFIFKKLIVLFSLLFSWKKIIVKSEDMYNDLGLAKVEIIPNGVNLERFKSLNKYECQKQLDWDSSKKHILFTANPNRSEKNYLLARDSVKLMGNKMVEIHCLTNIKNVHVPIWYNAADLVLLTSLWEGSPNAIKEAMACNRPIVSTNVGDVQWLFQGVSGCIICELNKEDCARAIIKMLEFDSSNGINRILKLNLSSEQIAEKIIELYRS